MLKGFRTTRSAGDEAFAVSAGRDTEDLEDILGIISRGIGYSAWEVTAYGNTKLAKLSCP